MRRYTSRLTSHKKRCISARLAPRMRPHSHWTRRQAMRAHFHGPLPCVTSDFFATQARSILSSEQGVLSTRRLSRANAFRLLDSKPSTPRPQPQSQQPQPQPQPLEEQHVPGVGARLLQGASQADVEETYLAVAVCQPTGKVDEASSTTDHSRRALPPARTLQCCVRNDAPVATLAQSRSPWCHCTLHHSNPGPTQTWRAPVHADLYEVQVSSAIALLGMNGLRLCYWVILALAAANLLPGEKAPGPNASCCLLR